MATTALGHYRVWCRFEPHYINPLTGRRGRWRVVFSCVDGLLLGVWVQADGGFLSAPASKQYKRGSIIRPHKELNRVLAARRLTQPVQHFTDWKDA